MKVVILDDENKVLDLICALIDWDALDLHLCGTAGDGEGALRLLESAKPDLLITDIKMPGMSGIEIIEKAKTFLPNLRAIVISGYSRFDYAQSAIRQGVINYLLKPINKEELNATLKKIIADAALSAQNASRTQRAEDLSRRLSKERAQAALLASIEWFDTPAFQVGTHQPQWDTRTPDGEASVTLDIERLGIASPIVFIAVKIDSVIFPCDMQTEKAVEKHLVDHLDGMGGSVSVAKDSVILSAFGGQDDAKAVANRVFEAMKKEQEIFRDYVFTVSYGKSAKRALTAIAQRLLHPAGHIYNGDDTATSGGDNGTSAADGFNLDEEHRQPPADVLIPLFASMVSGNKEEYLKRQKTAMEQFNAETAREMTDIVTEEARIRLTEKDAPLSAIDAMALTVNMPRSMEEMTKRMVQFLDSVYDAVSKDAEERCARPIREAQRYIAEHYSDNMLCLDTVADHVELSPNYLSALFKKNCQVGMAEYIQNLRIEKAKQMLTKTRDSIKQIAYSVGFNDPKHFSKTFKAVVGMKPNEYAKLYE